MKKNIRNISIFLILVFLTYKLIFKEQSFNEIINLIRSVDYKYIVIAVLCMCVYVLCDAMNITKMLKCLNEKSTFWKNIKYSLIGFFFSAITPAASGGQPMQIYYMHKENIKVANSTLTFLVNLSCMQIVTISLALFNLIFNYKYMKLPMIILFIIGILLNITALVLLLISIFSRRVSKGIIRFSVKVLKFFRVKRIEEKQEKMEKELEKYQKSAKEIRKNKATILRVLFITYIEYIALYSVTYFVYRALGFNKYNIFNLVGTQAVLYSTVSGIPLPGSVGASESAYLSLFGHVYSETKVLETAMLLNRLANFYLLVVISAFVVVINDIYVRTKYKKDKKEVENEKYLLIDNSEEKEGET